MATGLYAKEATANTLRRKSPDIVLRLAILLVWIAIWRFQELWPIVGKLQIPILTEFALVLAFFAGSSLSRRLKWARSRLFYAPFVLLGLMVLGLPFNLYPGQAVVFLEKDFSATLLLFIVIATSMREAYDLEWFAFMHLLGAIVYAAWIYKFVPFVPGGRLGDLGYYDSNDFGLLLVCSIPFAIYFLRPGVVAWKRVIALLALGLFAIMIVRSGSRGGFIGMVAVSVYVLLMYKAIPARLRIGALAVGTAVLLTAGSSSYWNLMSSIAHPSNDYNMTEVTGRKAIWKRGVGYMLSRPVVGVGVAAFTQAEGTLSAVAHEYAAQGEGLKWSTAHNSFVLAGAELGVGGLITFVFMILGCGRTLSGVNASSDENGVITTDDVAFARMLLGSLIGYSVAGFFISGTYFAYLYVIVGLTIAQQTVLRRRSTHARVNGPKVHAPPASRAQRQWRSPKAHWAPTG